jgi:hypothetical protein
MCLRGDVEYPIQEAIQGADRDLSGLAARLRICFGAGAANVAALRGGSARLETAALPRSGGFAA